MRNCVPETQCFESCLFFNNRANVPLLSAQVELSKAHGRLTMIFLALAVLAEIAFPLLCFEWL
jgi:hypothetical protein